MAKLSGLIEAYQAGPAQLRATRLEQQWHLQSPVGRLAF